MAPAKQRSLAHSHADTGGLARSGACNRHPQGLLTGGPKFGDEEVPEAGQQDRLVHRDAALKLLCQLAKGVTWWGGDVAGGDGGGISTGEVAAVGGTQRQAPLVQHLRVVPSH